MICDLIGVFKVLKEDDWFASQTWCLQRMKLCLTTGPHLKRMIFCFPQKSKYSVEIPKIPDQDAFVLEAHFEGKQFAPISERTFYCKDSRGEEGNFGAPGGDFGEFLLAASECNNDKTNDFRALLKEWIEKKCSVERPFYLHSDEAALKRVFEQIKVPFTDDLNSLTSDQRSAFLDALCTGPANYHGCGHLRLIREREEAYGIQKGLMNELFKGFFEAYWQGNRKVLFKIYRGELDARGLAIISGPLDGMKKSLLGRQKLENGQQCFILNQHAVSIYRRDHLVPFFEEKGAEKGLFELMEMKGGENAMKTAEALAAGKPIYRIVLKNAKK